MFAQVELPRFSEAFATVVQQVPDTARPRRKTQNHTRGAVFWELVGWEQVQDNKVMGL